MTIKVRRSISAILAVGQTLFCLLLGVAVQAQPALPGTGSSILEGKVLHAQTHLPLQGASVKLVKRNVGTITDSNGAFRLPLSKGEELSRLIVGYVGFKSDTVAFEQEFNPDSTSLTILLYPAETPLDLSAVTVRYERKSTEISLLGAIKQERINGTELLRAACCNLSESFETTPSVDVGYTDAVSGYRQIEMLGLAGSNTFYTRENIPENRGLASVTGLTFTPGTWLEGIQLSKGTGSVVNGYEGVAGQINTEWIKPFEAENYKWLLNGYQSIQGRSEGNLVYNHNFDERLSTNVLLYGRSDWHENDHNEDGFMDSPIGKLMVGSNRWFYFGRTGLEIQGGIKGVLMDATGGQLGYDYKKKTAPSATDKWGYHNKIKRLEGWAKIGKVYVDQPYKSMGLQLAAITHQQNSLYGLRGYNGDQKSFYANYIYQSIIGNTNHVIKAGASFQADDFDEWFDHFEMRRKEVVPGAFLEYSYNDQSKFNVIAGIRADHHNLYGTFFTPRLHVRYAPFEKTAIRASIGRAQRTANFLSESMGLMASNRQFLVDGAAINELADRKYPFQPEVSWNTGFNLTQKFTLGYRDGTFTVDYYYTDFRDQIVTDFETPGTVNFYNLQGKSYAHSLNFQLDYELIHKLNIRAAYRYLDVKSTFDGLLKTRPLIAKDRAFMNVNYETRNKWKFNYTVQWVSTKRLPATYSYSTRQSADYALMNLQINKSFNNDNLEVYLGAENLTDYMQDPLILMAENPADQGFDASQVWGPAMGRNIYIGFRVKL